MDWTRAFICGAAVIVVASPSMAWAAFSDCVSAAVDARTLLDRSALVFAGTLVHGGAATESGQYVLTFQADRVWKGATSSRATVYVLGAPFIGSYVFRPGERYLVAARVLQRDERTSNSIYDPAAKVFGIDRPCGAPLPLSLQADLDTITRPRTPHQR